MQTRREFVATMLAAPLLVRLPLPAVKEATLISPELFRRMVGGWPDYGAIYGYILPSDANAPSHKPDYDLAYKCLKFRTRRGVMKARCRF